MHAHRGSLLEIQFAHPPLCIGLRPKHGEMRAGTVVKGFRRQGEDPCLAEISGVRAGDELVKIADRTVSGQPYKDVIAVLQQSQSFPLRLTFKHVDVDLPAPRWAPILGNDADADDGDHGDSTGASSSDDDDMFHDARDGLEVEVAENSTEIDVDQRYCEAQLGLIRRKWRAAAYTHRGMDIGSLFTRLCGGTTGEMSAAVLFRAACCVGFAPRPHSTGVAVAASSPLTPQPMLAAYERWLLCAVQQQTPPVPAAGVTFAQFAHFCGLEPLSTVPHGGGRGQRAAVHLTPKLDAFGRASRERAKQQQARLKATAEVAELEIDIANLHAELAATSGDNGEIVGASENNCKEEAVHASASTSAVASASTGPPAIFAGALQTKMSAAPAPAPDSAPAPAPAPAAIRMSVRVPITGPVPATSSVPDGPSSSLEPLASTSAQAHECDSDSSTSASMDTDLEVATDRQGASEMLGEGVAHQPPSGEALAAWSCTLLHAVQEQYGDGVDLGALFSRFDLNDDGALSVDQLAELLGAMVPGALGPGTRRALLLAACERTLPGAACGLSAVGCKAFVKFVQERARASTGASSDVTGGIDGDGASEHNGIGVGSRVVVRRKGVLLNGTVHFVGPTEFSRRAAHGDDNTQAHICMERDALPPPSGRGRRRSSCVDVSAAKSALEATVYGIEFDAPAVAALGALHSLQKADLTSAPATPVGGGSGPAPHRDNFAAQLAGTSGVFADATELCDGRRHVSEARYFRTRGGARSGCFVRRADIVRTFQEWDSGSSQSPLAARRRQGPAHVPPPAPLAPNLEQLHAAARNSDSSGAAHGDEDAADELGIVRVSWRWDKSTIAGAAAERARTCSRAPARASASVCAATTHAYTPQLVAQQVQYRTLPTQGAPAPATSPVDASATDVSMLAAEWRVIPASAAAPSQMVRGLALGQRYEVRVRAANAFGWGNPSPATAVRVAAPKPPAPTGLRVMQARAPRTQLAPGAGAFEAARPGMGSAAPPTQTTGVDENARVSPICTSIGPTHTVLEAVWTRPVALVTVPIDRYALEFRPRGFDGAVWSRAHTRIPGHRTVAELSGLSPGRAYEVRVRAANAFGWGAASRSVICMAPAHKYSQAWADRPAEPSQLSVKTAENERARESLMHQIQERILAAEHTTLAFQSQSVES